MNWIMLVLIFSSVLCGFINGRMEEVNIAALQGCSKAVTLCLMLIGTMALWSGLMRIAERAGLCKKLSRLLAPLICRLFCGVKRDSKAMELISLNITANLLGLGNASTPLGIAAMTELAKQSVNQTATDDMVVLTVLGTASIQLIPTTVGILRLQYGASSPFDIIPAVLLSSAVSVTAALLTAKLFSKSQKTKAKKLQGGKA